MSDDTVLKLSQPSTFSDPLTEVLRSGARSLLARAVEAEVAAFLDGHSEARTEEGRRRLVRHGHLPEREIMTGIGPVAVRAPRVRDHTGQGAERIRFSSALLPPYARRSKSLEVLIPVLYLKGISTGDFAEALAALLGPDAGGLSASTVARLTEVWADEHAHWLKRDLSGTMSTSGPASIAATQCLWHRRDAELVGLDGVRESANCYLISNGAGSRSRPNSPIADGALGFDRGSVAPEASAVGWHRQRAQQGAQEPALEGKARSPGDLDGRDQEPRRQRLRRLHRDLRRQVRQGGRLSWQGSRERSLCIGSICAPPTRSKAHSPPATPYDPRDASSPAKAQNSSVDGHNRSSAITESSGNNLKPPPDLNRHQDSAIAHTRIRSDSRTCSASSPRCNCTM